MSESGHVSSNNIVSMNFSYSRVDMVCDKRFYVLDDISIANKDEQTFEFNEYREYPLVQYLNCRRKPFFASSTYFVGKRKVYEMTMEELEKITFLKPINPIYFCDLVDFLTIIGDEVLYRDLVLKANGAQLVVVDGVVTNPTPDTKLIFKDYDIQTGV